jgi:hypothetical protein
MKIEVIYITIKLLISVKFIHTIRNSNSILHYLNVITF